jgi:hypothetical protein
MANPAIASQRRDKTEGLEKRWDQARCISIYSVSLIHVTCLHADDNRCQSAGSSTIRELSNLQASCWMSVEYPSADIFSSWILCANFDFLESTYFYNELQAVRTRVGQNDLPHVMYLWEFEPASESEALFPVTRVANLSDSRDVGRE